MNDGMWTYEWQAGRQLKKMSRDGQALTFKYDHKGMRIQKVLEHSWYPETTNYTYHGKLLTHMTVYYYDWDEVAQQDKLHFFYDAQGRPAKINYNGIIYTYIHNLQGDIVGILDNSGNLVVEYKYDAWGKPIATTGSLAATLGMRNPFRYRGYVYDEEMGLYYLRSRYYNAHMGRFILSDTAMGDGLGNLYTYANNVFLGRADSDGMKTYAIGTQTVGILGTVSTSIAKGYCWDDLGNQGTFTCYAGLDGYLFLSDLEEDFSTCTVGLGTLSFGVFYQTTEFDSIEKLAGQGSSMGGSFDCGIGFGYDVAMDKPVSDNSGKAIGSQVSIGLGVGIDFAHLSNTYTIVEVTKRAHIKADKPISFGGAKRTKANSITGHSKIRGLGRKELLARRALQNGYGRPRLYAIAVPR